MPSRPVEAILLPSRRPAARSNTRLHTRGTSRGRRGGAGQIRPPLTLAPLHTPCDQHSKLLVVCRRSLPTACKDSPRRSPQLPQAQGFLRYGLTSRLRLLLQRRKPRDPSDSRRHRRHHFRRSFHSMADQCMRQAGRLVRGTLAKANTDRQGRPGNKGALKAPPTIIILYSESLGTFCSPSEISL